MRFIIVAHLLAAPLVVVGSQLDKINPLFNNKPNPFLQVLYLDENRISLSRDSSRIQLSEGGYVDLFLKDRKLWNLNRYDRDGRKLDAGDLKDGTGTVRLEFKKTLCEASFKSGSLAGDAGFSSRTGSKWYPEVQYTFKEGLLHGEAKFYSFLDRRFVVRIETYKDGYLQKMERFGRVSWILGFVGLGPRLLQPDAMCSRTIYQNGKFVSTECLMKKCRFCGM